MKALGYFKEIIMKLIFLDMDGVMNSHQSIHFFHEFMKLPNNWFEKYMPGKDFNFNHYEDELCPMAVSNMATLLKEYPDIRFVISSTWRIGRDEEWFEKLFRHIGMIGDRTCFRCDGEGHYWNSGPDGKMVKGSNCKYCDNGIWRDSNNNTQMVIGRTPRLGTERGEEIQKWIDDNPEIMKDVDNFVILDDDGDMCHFVGTEHFVKTDNKVGFDYIKKEHLSMLFGGYKYKFEDLEPNVYYKQYHKPQDYKYFKTEGGNLKCINSKGETEDGYYSDRYSYFSKIE
jgi:hypothetical protein